MTVLFKDIHYPIAVLLADFLGFSFHHYSYKRLGSGFSYQDSSTFTKLGGDCFNLVLNILVAAGCKLILYLYVYKNLRVNLKRARKARSASSFCPPAPA